ncbi:DUF1330 domain-containing protein [Kibdelosporangium aridum]|uniref:DUF1330 domain-containing protein n=1 Tax=Kibdelosporangium aridum TaxID=2030 RepID=UPI000523F7EF
MSAYVISETEALDEAEVARYRAVANKSLDIYGGEYLVRATKPAAAEGFWPEQQKIVVVRFPSIDRLREWYVSPEYGEALAISRNALTRRLLFVDGVG